MLSYYINKYIKSNLTRFRYCKKIKKIKNKKEKIKVLFYVTENSKWGYQSLYDILSKDNRFDPLIVVGILNGVHKGKDTTRNNLEENYKFFSSREMNVEYGYKNNKFIDLKFFKPDIIFYEQPWELPRSHRPYNVSKYAITCHCSYAFELFECDDYLYNKFYSLLYKFYQPHKLSLKSIERIINNKPLNYDVVGYPKLDIYKKTKFSDKFWKAPQKTKIIYAPHHSLEEGSLRLATFKENGQLILNWAKQHPETTWIFKPHPRFKHALLVNKIMTENEIEEYYKGWEEVGTVYTQGDYFDIFKSSDVMITDCGSFLAEYLPTNKPLIRPTNADAVKFNEVGQLLSSAYYQIENNEDLLTILDKVVIKKNDYKKDERLKIVSEFFDFNESSASKIYRGLLKEFGLNV